MLIGDILSLSSLDHEVSSKDIKFEFIDLTDLLQNLVKVFDRITKEEGITISLVLRLEELIRCYWNKL